MCLFCVVRVLIYLLTIQGAVDNYQNIEVFKVIHEELRKYCEDQVRSVEQMGSPIFATLAEYSDGLQVRRVEQMRTQ